MPALSVYTRPGALVNANNRSLAGDPAGVSIGPEAMTLVADTALPFSTLCDLVCGTLQARFALTRSALSVLRGLLSHAGSHSNRVWPSQALVAEEAGLSRASVERGVAALKAAGVARVIEDPDELAAGPRPRRGRGKLPVNTYDLSGLLRLVPAGLLRVLAPSAEPVSLVDPEPMPPDPFADPAAPVASKPCNVNKQGAGEAADGRAGAGARRGFRKAKMRDISRKTPAQAASVAALRAVGIWGAVAEQIVADKGEQWALELVEYGKQQQKPVGAAWYRRTWEGWQGWPEWFERKQERERAAAVRVVCAPAAQIAALRPVERPEAGNVSADALAALSGLPEGEKRALEQRALAEVIAEAGWIERRMIERRGVDHRKVQERAARLLSEASGGRAGP